MRRRLGLRDNWDLIARVAIGLLTAVAAAPVAAQTAPPMPTTITPLTVAPDHNNVSISDGLIRVDMPSLSIPADPRLKFDLVQNAMPYLTARLGGSPVESSVAVHYGGSTSTAFSCANDDVCRDIKLAGDVLGGSVANGGPYTFTLAPGGAVYTFDQLISDSGPVQSRQVLYYASSVAYPEGEVITYTYQTAQYASGTGPTQYRLTQMSSNLGFYITFTYQGTDVNQNSWKTVAQASMYNGSAPGTPLAQLTYSGSTITDLAGRTYTCSGCFNYVGGQVEWSTANITLPTEGSAEEVVTPTLYNGAQPALVTSVVRDGVTWSYAYANYRLNPGATYTYDNVVVTGPVAFNQTYTIQPNPGGPNLVSSIVDSIGRRTAYSYDANLRPILVTYPEGNSVQIGYDNYGNVTSKVSHAKPGSNLAAITESASIDANGCGQTQVLCYRPTVFSDGLGRETDYLYDTAGRLIQQTDPADQDGVRRIKYLTYGFNSGPTLVRECGLGTTCGTSAEIKTQYAYWGATTLPSSETRFDGTTNTSLTTTYTYDNAGRLLVEDGPLPGTGDAKYYRYDILGRKTWEIGPANADGSRPAKRTTYRDADNKVIAVETGTIPDPNNTNLSVYNRVDMGYDAHRNPVQVATTGGGTLYKLTNATYDDRGQETCSAVRMNTGVYGGLPPSACTLSTSGSFGPDRITHNSYDAAGQLLQVQKAYGTALQENYATYTYSPNGKQASVQDANGNLAGLTYDGFDRLAQWTFPSPTQAGHVNGGDYESYGYDAAGNRTSFRKRDGRMLTFLYDGLNRVVNKSMNGGCAPIQVGACPPASATRGVVYGYDVLGLQTYAQFDGRGGEGVTSTYNGYGQLTTSTIAMGGTSRTLSYLYDVAGNRTQIMHPDGVHFDMSYDAGDRAVNATWYAPTTGTVAFVAITYDGLGRRTDINRASSYTGYFWNGLGQRLGSTNQRFVNAGFTESYSYNPADQITLRSRDSDDYAYTGAVAVNRSYAVNGLNQYSAAGPASFTYDANGNLTSDGANTYVYDAENRMVSSSAYGMTLTYDPLGRLWQATSSALGNTQFLSDGDHTVLEYDGSNGSIRRRFMWGPGVDEPILQDDGGQMNCSGTRFLHTDHLGSIVALADCWGNRWAVNGYDEYGIGNANNYGRFQYTGQAWLADLGMYYYKARMYSPTLGRFMQTDPIGYKDQINLYEYVGDDPVDGRDPTGQEDVYHHKGGNTTSVTYTPTGSNISKSITPANAGNGHEFGPALAAAKVGGGNTGGQTVNSPGSLTLGEANRHFRDGSGTPVDIDASNLTVKLEGTPPRVGGNIVGSVTGISKWIVYGRVGLIRTGGSTYSIRTEKYDFDIKPWNSLRNDARNLETMAGHTLAGPGVGFETRFYGHPTVVP